MELWIFLEKFGSFKTALKSVHEESCEKSLQTFTAPIKKAV